MPKKSSEKPVGGKEGMVLGVSIERITKEKCVIVNAYDRNTVREAVLHGGLIRREVDRHLPLKTIKGMSFNTLPPGTICSGHWHNREEIWIILEGESTWIDCDGSERRIKKGDFIYITPNGYHECRNETDKPLNFIYMATQLPGAPYKEGFFEPIEKVTLKATPLGEFLKNDTST